MRKTKRLPLLLVVGAVAILGITLAPYAVHAAAIAVAHPVAVIGPIMAVPLLGMGLPTTEDFQHKVLRGVEAMQSEISNHHNEIENVKRQQNEFAGVIKSVQRSRLNSAAGEDGRMRKKGRMSDDGSVQLASTFIAQLSRTGKLEAFVSDERIRSMLADQAREVLGLGQRALGTGEIPLPTDYSGELKELIADFGVARQNMEIYPITAGASRPPRMGTRPAFGSIAMSAAFSEKKPTITFAALESHKIGGIVIVPREIDDKSIVAMGRFLARYGAIEFARAEDTWAFYADGTSTYESVVGIIKYCTDNAAYNVVLGATKTHFSDATLADFRAMRGAVNTGALSGGKYYLHNTWEARLRTFKTQQEPDVFMYRPDGTATLDGFEIVWTNVLPVYGTTVTASATMAAFGKLDFWFFGERGTPRIDTSADVYFVNDQLATRFIEEIDYDYSAVDAVSILTTAAS